MDATEALLDSQIYKSARVLGLSVSDSAVTEARAVGREALDEGRTLDDAFYFARQVLLAGVAHSPSASVA